MIKINENYFKLQSSYLFSKIAGKVNSYQEKNPDKNIIKLGIGDVTKALPDACINALHKAIDEMSNDSTFRGYGPEQGYAFLRNAAAENDFNSRGINIKPDEIFISDGAKCDTGNIQELFSNDIKVAVPDPVYPVYVDTNVMAGRSGDFKNDGYEGIIYLESNEQNNFVPDVPGQRADLIYLCFPNNPTGATASIEDLKKWVEYARENNSLILFDAAYEAFIRDDSIVHSIYEIEGAREVAVEFRSFSKTAGFTGLRCAYTVVPHECRVFNSTGSTHMLHQYWNRRHSTKFNGVSYPVQRAAEAVFSNEGKKEVRQLCDYYLENAFLIRNKMEEAGYKCSGGKNSPYIWIKTDSVSWDFFDKLLYEAGVVCTPGSGFGSCGKGHIRLSAFNSRENVQEALRRIEKTIK